MVLQVNDLFWGSPPNLDYTNVHLPRKIRWKFASIRTLLSRFIRNETASKCQFLDITHIYLLQNKYLDEFRRFHSRQGSGLELQISYDFQTNFMWYMHRAEDSVIEARKNGIEVKE